MGFFKNKEEVLAAAHHYCTSIIRSFNRTHFRIGDCALYLHIILVIRFH